MRILSRAVLLLALASLLPGCAWFVIGGVAALFLGSGPAEEETSVPAVFLTPITVPVSGDVDVEFALSDQQSDPVAIQASYSTDGTVFVPATPVTGTATAGLASTPAGVAHHFLWDSLFDVGTAPQGAVTFRIVPSDATGAGAAREIGPFTVDNNGVPQASSVAPAAPLAEAIAVTYVLADAEGDDADVTVEWREGASGVFVSCTQGPGGDGQTALATSPGGTAHSFLWDSEADTACCDVAAVEIRVTPRDTKQGSSATSAPFTVANNDPPVVPTLVLPASDVTGTATVEYVIRDSHADTSSVELQFKRESDGSDWAANGLPATPDAGDPATVTHNRATSVAGVNHVYPWDSDASSDLPGEDAEIRLRIRASDDGGATWGPWTISTGTFWIRNDTAPALEMGNVTAHDSGIIYLPYTCSDAEGHDVSVLVEYRPFGAAGWRRATAGPGTTPLRFSAAPGGTAGLFSWDSKRDFLVGQGVSIRMTPSEATKAGLPVYTSLSVANDETEHHMSKRSLPSYQIYATAQSLNGRVAIAGGFGGGTAGRSLYLYDPALDRWSSRALLGTARGYPASAVVDGVLYVMGGFYGSVTATMEAYDWTANAWSYCASMASPRSKLGAAALGGRIYAMGGETTSSGPAVNTVEIYDPASNAWSAGPPMPAARKELACTALGGKIYAAGGSSNTLQILDGATGLWSVGPPMPRNRSDFGLVAAGGRVYAVGGWGAGVMAEVDEYDPERNTWFVRTPLNMARSALGVASLDGKIYAMSGWNGSNIPDVESYVPLTETWTTLPAQPAPRLYLGCAALNGDLHTAGGSGASAVHEAFQPFGSTWLIRPGLPQGRSSPGVAAADGRLYVVGGNNGSTVTNTTQIFNASTNVWTTGAAMPTAREALGCASWGGRIYAIGGKVGTVKQTAVEEYDPAANTWRTMAPIPTGRWDFGIAALEDEIFVVAGWHNDNSLAWYLDTVEAFDPAANAWRSCAIVPAERRLLGCVALGGRIYTMGGSGQNGNIRNAEIYDPRTDTWTGGVQIPAAGMTWAGALGSWAFTAGTTNYGLRSTLDGLAVSRTDLPTPVSGSELVLLGTEALALGGGTGTAAATASAAGTSLVEAVSATPAQPFDLDRSWTSRAAMPMPLSDFASAAFNGRAFAVGGRDDIGNPRSEAYAYDPGADTWAVLPSMAAARFAPGAARVGDRLYVVGGALAGGAKSAALEVFDLQTSSWVTGGFAPLATARSHMGCAAFEGRIYVVGGEGAGGATLGSVERYDPATNAWTPLNPLATGVKGALCLLERGRLALFGGEVFASGTSRISDRILFYEVESDRWKESSAVLPYPARDLAGASGWISWSHRGGTQTDEFCILGGGHDGTSRRGGFFRFHTR